MVTIQSVRFGSAKIGKRRLCIRDILIYPDGTVHRRALRRWIWHHHGLGKDDIAPLVEAGAKTLVIGTGVFSWAKVTEEARAFARESKAELLALPSRQAAEKFNSLQAPDAKIGTLLHLMC